ncbi:outer membrane beta-barrel protein [Pedobacter sp. MC2016-14]|uniref:outer membrane beta-barrel family protein n=1 Tax=Pedobacter sp. MC2016-14 TaxID=2897327 RepID=UPI001E30374C|nr:outer membrane beta-barrel family protein [Pedobacter sp. MC2016-14]MCD0487032.1 outer membrane beta-barrel protein [Pedobacter sp. MC2016-14]
MKPKLIFFIVLNFLFCLKTAERSFAALAAPLLEKGVISGKVVEEVGALPVPSAVVALYVQNAEQPLFTTATDENGDFKFNALKPGLYRIKVSYVGFVPLIVNEILLNAKTMERGLGSLKLSSDQNNLSEVTITVAKPIIEFGADMITYNVGQSILAEGSTAADLLKEVPMVQVDIEGNATIAGKRSTRIFIDGKPSDYMTSNISDLLSVLPSDAIEKIEVMTNPPSKYSGDGEGIINIVLKKGFKIGFNGNAGITSGIQGNANANTNMSYKARTYSLNGSAAFKRNVNRSTNSSLRENFSADTTSYNDQYTTSKNESTGGNYRAALDWDITPKKNLRVSTNFNNNNSNNHSENTFNFLNEAKELSRIREQVNTGNGSSKSFVFNADYEVQLDTGGAKLAMGITFNTGGNQSYRLLDRAYTYPTVSSPFLQENNNDVGNTGLTFNLDFDKRVFKKRDLIELGLQYNFRRNDNDMLVQKYDFSEQAYLIDPGLTNQFLYNEHIFSGYGSYNYKKDGWGVKTGIRAELTDVTFDLSTGDAYNVKPYLSLFPNISLNRFFRKRYTIGATYSIRINRPRENTLNPQINNTDSLNISFGNPNLSPAYTHQMDLSFGVFGEKWSFTPRLSYSTSRGVIERFRTVVGEISETTYDNVGTNNSLSLILIGNYRPTKTISANGNFSVIQTDYTSKLNAALNRNGISLRGKAGLSMQLPLKTAFEANLNYANNINAQGRSKGNMTTGFAARKMFLKNRLNARVNISDPFGRRNNRIFSEGINFRQDNYSTSNTSNVTFSLNYRFTKIKKLVVPPPK